MEATDIEACIPKAQRLRDGIFFTPAGTVEAILDRLPAKGIATIIDSAAGSGNFLLAAARRWPEARIWGIEKNEAVYRMTAPVLARRPHITYLRGDCLTDRFDIPPCDLYLGNPPFINHTDLEPDYRERLRPLWKDSGLAGSGYPLLLGHSRADVAALIFHETLRRFVKPGGRFGVVLPLSLLSGGGANAAFHRFSGITVTFMKNGSGSIRFRDAVHPSFYLTGIRGGETLFPVPAEGFSAGGWSPAPTGSAGWYRARQGVNTLGANRVFFFDGTVPFESGLTRPLYRGRDPGLWTGEPTGRVLLPYHENGSLITERELADRYPEALQWLAAHRLRLENRKSRHTGGCWYALFGVGPYTFAPWKVIWRSMGQNRIRVSVSSEGIANQALQGYIPAGSEGEAHYLAALLNSEACHRRLVTQTRPGTLSFGQPGTVSRLPIPPYDSGNTLMKALSEAAARCRDGKVENIPPEIEEPAENLLGSGV